MAAKKTAQQVEQEARVILANKGKLPKAETEVFDQLSLAIAESRREDPPSIQIRLKWQDYEDLQALIERTGAKSAAEVVRNLIRLAAGRSSSSR